MGKDGEAITYEGLRRLGFRIDSHHVDNSVHMILSLQMRRSESFLEIAPSPMNSWTIWLRSDMAHSRCRFVFLRDVTSLTQIEKLYEAITDKTLEKQEIDRNQFHLVLSREQAEAKLRYHEYASGERHGYVP